MQRHPFTRECLKGGRKHLSRLAKRMGIAAPEEAITLYGAPEIMHMDQGPQLISMACTGLLKEHVIQIKMDGKGAWRDHLFIVRLWRSVK